MKSHVPIHCAKAAARDWRTLPRGVRGGTLQRLQRKAGIVYARREGDRWYCSGCGARVRVSW